MFLILDAISMIREIRRQGRAIGLWGGFLNIPQMVGGLIFVWTIEGAAILISVIVTLVIAGQIHKRTPFSRIIGLCHIPWLGLLPWLVHRLVTVELIWPLKAWVAYVAVTILISLVFDVLDVCRYARGDRTFSWAR